MHLQIFPSTPSSRAGVQLGFQLCIRRLGLLALLPLFLPGQLGNEEIGQGGQAALGLEPARGFKEGDTGVGHLHGDGLLMSLRLTHQYPPISPL